MIEMKTGHELILEARPRKATRWGIQEAAGTIVEWLLAKDEIYQNTAILEASVHRPRRGRVLVATFSGPTGGQVWRSTGLTNREQAQLVARRWEAEARAQRDQLGGRTAKPTLPARPPEPALRRGLITQREVAVLLNMSERGVREVERRAFCKLRNHPLLRQVWRQFLAGELDERRLGLTREEIVALFAVARTSEERRLIQNLVPLV